MENTKKKFPQYSSEVRERVVRMVFKYQHEYVAQRAALGSIAFKIGCTGEI